MSEDDELNLTVMANALSRVASYTDGVPLKAFVAEQMRIDATAINLLVIGEHAGRLSAAMRAAIPAPWIRIVNLRHQLAHGYASIDPEQLWSIATRNAPELALQVTAWLERP